MDGAVLLDQVSAWIGRYLSVPSEHCIVVITLWAAHTHGIEVFYVTPRLIIDSAEPESGKTRVLELLNLLVRASIFTMNTTIAALYRRLNSEQRTVLLDETDAIFAKGAAQNHEDLRALLNAGYKRGATVDRCVIRGDDVTVVEFPAFAPAALAGIAGNMPPTITTRAVTVHMRRRAPGEVLAEFIEEDAKEEAAPLKLRLGDWMTAVADRLKGARPSMPDGVRDRQAEVWRALLAVADAAGGPWPKRARDACKHFVCDTDAGALSLGVRLLADLKGIFGEQAFLATAAILNKLHALDEAPWGDLRGKPLSARRLADMLGKYGIAPDQDDTHTVRGYRRADFADAFTRYLPPKPSKPSKPSRRGADQGKNLDGSQIHNPSTTRPEHDAGQIVDGSANANRPSPDQVKQATLDGLDGLDASPGDSQPADNKPCDRCQATPTRVDHAGNRLCAPCGRWPNDPSTWE